jgi:hypothetical protein
MFVWQEMSSNSIVEQGRCLSTHFAGPSHCNPQPEPFSPSYVSLLESSAVEDIMTRDFIVLFNCDFGRFDRLERRITRLIRHYVVASDKGAADEIQLSTLNVLRITENIQKSFRSKLGFS